jgi:GGDEF domain-containing protein
MKVIEIGTKVLNRISECKLIGKFGTYRGSGSIGIALASGENLSIETIMEWADQASYDAKKAGGNQTFSIEMISLCNSFEVCHRLPYRHKKSP